MPVAVGLAHWKRWAEARALSLSTSAQRMPVTHLESITANPGEHEVSTSITSKRGYQLECQLALGNNDLETLGRYRHSLGPDPNTENRVG